MPRACDPHVRGALIPTFCLTFAAPDRALWWRQRRFRVFHIPFQFSLTRQPATVICPAERSLARGGSTSRDRRRSRNVPQLIALQTSRPSWKAGQFTYFLPNAAESHVRPKKSSPSLRRMTHSANRPRVASCSRTIESREPNTGRTAGAGSMPTLVRKRSARAWHSRAVSAAAALALASLACRDGTGPRGPTTPPGAADRVAGSWAAVTVGDHNACALDRAGRVWCWGDNARGRLGTSDTADRVVIPSLVVGLPDAPVHAVVAGGAFLCVLVGEGEAYCWGDNESGELGRGQRSGVEQVPGAVAGELRFRALSAGSSHACGVTADGTAYCWGDGSRGQLGIGKSLAQCDSSLGGPCAALAPTRVTGGITFTQVSAGRSHTCGVASDGSAYCWGDGAYGALGAGAQGQCSYYSNHAECLRFDPIAVSGGLRFTRLSAARGLHTCGVTTAGAAYCWGLATGDVAIGAAELGNAAYAGINAAAGGSLVPVPVDGGLLFRTVTAGGRVTCGLTTDSHAVCWGSNNFFQLGIGVALDPTFSTRPRAVWMPAADESPAVTDDDNVCALSDAGRIFCWGGRNFYGELGSGPVSPVGASGGRVCFRGTPTPLTETDRTAQCFGA